MRVGLAVRIVIVVMCRPSLAARRIRYALLDACGRIDDSEPLVAFRSLLQQHVLERHVDLEEDRRPAKRENLLRRGLEGVRVLARLDQHIDLHVLAADLLDQIRQRRNAGEHRQAVRPARRSSRGAPQPQARRAATSAAVPNNDIVTADEPASSAILPCADRRRGAGLAHQMHGVAVFALGQGVVLGELDPVLPLIGREDAAAFAQGADAVQAPRGSPHG